LKLDDKNFEFRFAGIERLYGKASLALLKKSSIGVIGLGGVGSWTVEALARSGVGNIILVDLDEICENNINRQSHALSESIGRPKGEVLKERILAINPWCQVAFIQDFFTADTADKILSMPMDYLVDAIDGVSHKVLCLTECLNRNIPLIMTGAAGGKRDPSQIQVSDLGKSFNDNLLFRVRKNLRRKFHDYKGKKRIGVDCVFSPEKSVFYNELGQSCEMPEDVETGVKLDCQQGLGSASYVTGVFGFMAAAHVIHSITKNSTGPS